MLVPDVGGRERRERKGVNPGFELNGQHGVNLALPLDPRHTLERTRDDADVEMGLAARPGSGMTFVTRAVVDNLQ